MSVSIYELEAHCNELLKPQLFKDYCPNGLQVDAAKPVKKIVTGVTANQALIDEAVKLGADLILVHHGYFWPGESEPLTGIKGKRIRTLLQNEISLMAYHLPIDAHPVLGNNRQLADLLGLSVSGGMDASDNPIGNWGVLNPGSEAKTIQQFIDELAVKLDREPQVLANPKDLSKPLSKIAWCTGAAQSMFDKAIALGVDCYLSGEVSEQTAHLAVESGVVYIGAGHHATERYGVKALGEHLQETYDVEVVFVDIDNPV